MWPSLLRADMIREEILNHDNYADFKRFYEHIKKPGQKHKLNLETDLENNIDRVRRMYLRWKDIKRTWIDPDQLEPVSDDKKRKQNMLAEQRLLADSLKSDVLDNRLRDNAEMMRQDPDKYANFYRKVKTTSDPVKRKRVIRNRQGGLGLPSSRKQEMDPSSFVPDERPDVLMWGERNVLPDMQEQLELMRRSGEIDSTQARMMHDERDLQVPDYLQHFAKGWTPPDPDESDEEAREAKAKAKVNSEKKAMEQRRERENAEDLEDRMYNEKHSGATFLDRLDLLAALEENEMSEEKEKPPTKQLADERRAAMRKKMKITEKSRELSPEPDTEKRIWPSAVPAYLLEEKEKPKREWWHDITHQSRPARQQPIVNNYKEESSSDPEIIDEPPDPPDRR